MSEARVFIVDYESTADYKVFFTDYESSEHNTSLITPGRLVQYEAEANVKVYIVDYESSADIKITRQHFPK